MTKHYSFSARFVGAVLLTTVGVFIATRLTMIFGALVVPIPECAVWPLLALVATGLWFMARRIIQWISTYTSVAVVLVGAVIFAVIAELIFMYVARLYYVSIFG